MPGTILSITPFTLLGGREHDAHMTDIETVALKSSHRMRLGWVLNPHLTDGGPALLLIERNFFHSAGSFLGQPWGMTVTLRSSRKSLRVGTLSVTPLLNTVLGTCEVLKSTAE